MNLHLTRAIRKFRKVCSSMAVKTMNQQTYQNSFESIDGQRQALAKAAAEWWASFLYQPSIAHNSGDAHLDASFKAYSTLIHRPALDGQTIEQFKEALAAGIEWYICDRANDEPAIQCDYHPHWLLKKAAEYVGIQDLDGRIPIKTIMLLYADRIECKVGYGQPYEVIYQRA